MKILITGWYVLRSIALRGLINSYRMLRDDRRYEAIFGIRTSSLKKSGSADYFHYQGASYRVLFRIFDELPLVTRQFTFFDIGCGKGRAVFVAENSGFEICGGIEIDPELVEVAKINLSTYLLKKKSSSIQFHAGNALHFPYPQSPTVYFLFNPFSEEILTEVLKKILISGTQELWFIYMNPRFPQPFANANIPLVSVLKTRWYTEAHIFCRKPDSLR